MITRMRLNLSKMRRFRRTAKRELAERSSRREHKKRRGLHA
jgi:hypothetical protein